ncbi:T9SS type A sorting domain-containing protein [Saccharicrinis sp. FJH2]|uniref:leucine-rich repeat domain-containing protein n=1 Tax=Saccharicrinis sp. FJH65 TaxID=3344659 RepID=UPI0035F24585
MKENLKNLLMFVFLTFNIVGYSQVDKVQKIYGNGVLPNEVKINKIQKAKIDLKLFYENRVKIINDKSFVIESDSLALVSIYNTNGGENWHIGEDSVWLEGPIYRWEGVKVKNQRVVSLNLGHVNLIGNIPPEIGDLTEIQFINLKYNEISSIPSEIGNLNKLSYLNLAWNKLSIIPNSIGDLKQLIYLDFWANDIENVPSEISNLDLLEYLGLDDNKIVSIPTEIGTLNNLRKLCVQGNNLNNLPDLSGLVNIQWLFLYSNSLTFNDLTETNLDFDEVEWVVYSPQKNIILPHQTNQGNIRIMRCVLNEPGITYQWYKYPDQIIVGETERTIELNDSFYGLVYCKSKNEDYPELILSTDLLGRNSGLTKFSLANLEPPINEGALIGEFSRNTTNNNFFNGYYISNLTYERIGVIQIDHEDFEKKLTPVDSNTCSTYLGPFDDVTLYISINKDNSVDVEVGPNTWDYELHGIDWGTSSYNPENGEIHLFYGYTINDGERKFEEIFSYNEDLHFPKYTLASGEGLNQGDNDNFIIENNVLKTSKYLDIDNQSIYSVYVNISDLVYGINYTEEFIINLNTNHISTKNYIQSAQFYPNPTNGIISIKESSEISNVRIFDLKGQLIYSINFLNNEATINLLDEECGMYLIIYNKDESYYYQKLILK